MYGKEVGGYDLLCVIVHLYYCCTNWSDLSFRTNIKVVYGCNPEKPVKRENKDTNWFGSASKSSKIFEMSFVFTHEQMT